VAPGGHANLASEGRERLPDTPLPKVDSLSQPTLTTSDARPEDARSAHESLLHKKDRIEPGNHHKKSKKTEVTTTGMMPMEDNHEANGAQSRVMG
jgi:hypothetical protein